MPSAAIHGSPRSPDSSPPGLLGLMTTERWLEVARIVGVAAVILLYRGGLVPLPILLVAVAVGLYPLVRTGVLDLVHEHKIGTEIFITLATLIALIGGEYTAGAIIMVIILIAEFIADLNTERARASIKALIGSVPQQALVRREGREEMVPVSELRVGDIVIVRAGEKIPVDGIVRHGHASVDQAPITGESVPVEKAPGGPVFAGTVVDLGALDIETEKVGGDTMFSRIVALVETAEEHKAPVQRLADQVAAWLIPVVFVFLLAVYFATHDLRKIITLLIFTSPAELGLATPLVMIAAIARAARAGILLKGGVYLEQLAKVDLVAFDKTGTLTIGHPEVVSVEPTEGISKEELLRLAAGAERRSSHPLAKAVVRRAEQEGVKTPEPAKFEVLRGQGIRAELEGRTVLVGKPALLKEHGVEVPVANAAEARSTVYVAADGKLLGAIYLADPPRPNAREAIARLKRSGIRQVVMLTGDNSAIAQRIGAELGVDRVEADLLPDQKVEVVRRLQGERHRVAMVGDGINDAPALAAADVGIAMGVAGTQAAIEAADVALMTDDLGKIVEARVIAARAYRTIKENLIFGVGVVHVLGITAALLGFIGPIQAAVIHLGPDILVFLNSVKLLRIRLDANGAHQPYRAVA